MLNWLLDLVFALPLLALCWGAWHLLGVLAGRMGTGRLQVLGGASLVGWLISR